MALKLTKQNAGIIQVLIIVGIIVTVIGALSGCASTDSESAAKIGRAHV